MNPLNIITKLINTILVRMIGSIVNTSTLLLSSKLSYRCLFCRVILNKSIHNPKFTKLNRCAWKRDYPCLRWRDNWRIKLWWPDRQLYWHAKAKLWMKMRTFTVPMIQKIKRARDCVQYIVLFLGDIETQNTRILRQCRPRPASALRICKYIFKSTLYFNWMYGQPFNPLSTMLLLRGSGGHWHCEATPELGRRVSGPDRAADFVPNLSQNP